MATLHPEESTSATTLRFFQALPFYENEQEQNQDNHGPTMS